MSARQHAPDNVDAVLATNLPDNVAHPEAAAVIEYAGNLDGWTGSFVLSEEKTNIDFAGL
jgi:hypothetical protein